MKPPPFRSVHQVYMPSFGEKTKWDQKRWQAHGLAATDEHGNVWGLYYDAALFAESQEMKFSWHKFTVEAAE